MVAVRWPRWPPCPYMVKIFKKSFVPEPRMPWSWVFAQIIGDERSTKVAKIIVVHWRLTFLWRGQVCFPMHLCGHHTFVWEKCWEFNKTTSPLRPLGQCCSNFMWSLLRFGERKIAKMVAVHWPRWPPCSYMVKPLKIFSRTEDAFRLNLCTNHQGRKVYQSC